MRLDEVFENELDVINPTPIQLAEHYGLPLDFITIQINEGVDIEMKQYIDEDVATEIAIDNLLETIDFYESMFDDAVSKIKGTFVSPRVKDKIQMMLKSGMGHIEIGQALGLDPRATASFLKNAGF